MIDEKNRIPAGNFIEMLGPACVANMKYTRFDLLDDGDIALSATSDPARQNWISSREYDRRIVRSAYLTTETIVRLIQLVKDIDATEVGIDVVEHGLYLAFHVRGEEMHTLQIITNVGVGPILERTGLQGPSSN